MGWSGRSKPRKCCENVAAEEDARVKWGKRMSTLRICSVSWVKREFVLDELSKERGIETVVLRHHLLDTNEDDPSRKR